MGITVKTFFQHMPPYPGAASLRGHSIAVNLAKLMSLNGDSLIVYCSSSSPDSIQGASVLTLGVPEVENFLSLKKRLLGELLMGFRAARMMLFTGRKPDLLVISSPGYISALVQCFFATLCRTPYVLEMRDIYPQVYVEAKLLSKNSFIYRMLGFMSKTMYSNAKLVICATKGLAREVVDVAPCVRVEHIYNGFPSYFLERQNIKHERFTVCFHGILGFFQDIDSLLAVAERLGEFDIDVVVIGYGRKQESFKNCNLSNVRFLGRLPFASTIEEVARCHIGLCLRVDDEVSKDAFPVKVWEYLGLGMPSIVSPPCEAGDFLEDNGCGVAVKSGDIDAVVSVVLKARDDYAFFVAMSSNCRNLAGSFTREATGLAAAHAIYDVALRRLICRSG